MYILRFDPFFLDYFFFSFTVVNIYSSANFPSLLYRRELSPDCTSLILKRSILFATKFDARQESSSYTSMTKNERALGVVRDPSRAATALHGLLIFISCNIYRGAIAVRRGKVAGSVISADIV